MSRRRKLTQEKKILLPLLPTRTWTWDLLFTSPAFYHWAFHLVLCFEAAVQLQVFCAWSVSITVWTFAQLYDDPVHCSPGYYCNMSMGQVPCPPGFYCPEASSFPIRCPQGHYCGSHDDCNSTDAGQSWIISYLFIIVFTGVFVPHYIIWRVKPIALV